MFLEGNTQFGDQICGILLGSSYHRLQPLLKTVVELDDVTGAPHTQRTQSGTRLSKDTHRRPVAPCMHPAPYSVPTCITLLLSPQTKPLKLWRMYPIP